MANCDPLNRSRIALCTVLDLIQGSGHARLAYPTVYLQGMKMKKLTKQ